MRMITLHIEILFVLSYLAVLYGEEFNKKKYIHKYLILRIIYYSSSRFLIIIYITSIISLLVSISKYRTNLPTHPVVVNVNVNVNASVNVNVSVNVTATVNDRVNVLLM